VAWTWPLRTHVLPGTLGTVVVGAAAFRSLGVAVVSAGLVLHAAALWAFAESWRSGIDREARAALVTGGVFAWTRNPIYLALDLQAIGTFLVLGRLVFLALAMPIVILLHAQIRREERFLARAYGDAYREYCSRVGRYAGRL
jgi:protein-S-isoprenylcysteine O-methyltransferase Ste14